eukprot:s4301_g6.t1
MCWQCRKLLLFLRLHFFRACFSGSTLGLQFQISVRYEFRLQAFYALNDVCSASAAGEALGWKAGCIWSSH